MNKKITAVLTALAVFLILVMVNAEANATSSTTKVVACDQANTDYAQINSIEAATPAPQDFEQAAAEPVIRPSPTLMNCAAPRYELPNWATLNRQVGISPPAATARSGTNAATTLAFHSLNGGTANRGAPNFNGNFIGDQQGDLGTQHHQANSAMASVV